MIASSLARRLIVATGIPVALAGCIGFLSPEIAPAIDVIGRVTLPSGAPAADVAVSGATWEAALCDLPGPARLTTVTNMTAADGTYRLRVPSDSAGPRCLAIGARVPGGGTGKTQVATARSHTPYAVVRVDLLLPCSPCPTGGSTGTR